MKLDSDFVATINHLRAVLCILELLTFYWSFTCHQVLEISIRVTGRFVPSTHLYTGEKCRELRPTELSWLFPHSCTTTHLPRPRNSKIKSTSTAVTMELTVSRSKAIKIFIDVLCCRYYRVAELNRFYFYAPPPPPLHVSA